jgi:hypothetical protein
MELYLNTEFISYKEIFPPGITLDGSIHVNLQTNSVEFYIEYRDEHEISKVTNRVSITKTEEFPDDSANWTELTPSTIPQLGHFISFTTGGFRSQVIGKIVEFNPSTNYYTIVDPQGERQSLGFIIQDGKPIPVLNQETITNAQNLEYI